MIKLLTMLCFAVAVSGCGPEWAECETCKPGEASATSADGGQIPVVVNVTVNVDQNQSQNQGQGQVQTNTNTTTNPPAATPDAGQPPKVDAGTPKPACDAGQPVCRQVCTCTETRYVCKNSHKDTANKHECSCGVERTYSKCTHEVTQCS